MKQKLSIVKIGGNIIEHPAALTKFLALFSKLEGHKILVHGGGKKANHVLKKMGLEPNMVNGRRITDADTLEVAIMVYGGLVNKTIVSKLQASKTNAIGISGADGNTIRANKRPVKEIDYGFVGDVTAVDIKMIGNLLKATLVPVFCALTHDGHGQLLNTNADTIAAELSGGMSRYYDTILYYCFEKNGVLEDINDENSIIPIIDSRKYPGLLNSGVIVDGMLPKIQNSFHALERGATEVRIGNLDLFKKESKNYTTIVL